MWPKEQKIFEQVGVGAGGGSEDFLRGKPGKEKLTGGGRGERGGCEAREVLRLDAGRDVT